MRQNARPNCVLNLQKNPVYFHWWFRPSPLEGERGKEIGRKGKEEGKWKESEGRRRMDVFYSVDEIPDISSTVCMGII